MACIMMCTQQILLEGSHQEEWDGWGMWNMGERRGAYRVLVGKPEGQWPLWRIRHRWDGNSNIGLQDIGCKGAGLCLFGSGQVAGSCEHGNEFLGVIKCANFLSSWETISFSRRTLLQGLSYLYKKFSRLSCHSIQWTPVNIHKIHFSTINVFSRVKSISHDILSNRCVGISSGKSHKSTKPSQDFPAGTTVSIIYVAGPFVPRQHTASDMALSNRQHC
jgi:hypothetical protein